MIQSRIIWALCIVAAIVLYLFSDEYSALVIVVLVIAMPLLLSGLNQILARKVTLTLSAPVLAQKDKEFTGQLIAHNGGVAPLSPLSCTLVCTNMLTGEEVSSKVLFSVGAKAHNTVAFSFASSHCGGLCLTVQQARVFDCFGLFSARIKGEVLAITTVLPHTFSSNLAVVPNRTKDIEADEYSQTQAGTDPSETFAIRDYRPGDSLKQIHWKLTSKYDQFIVKELGLPVRHSFLVLLETSLEETAQRNPQVADALGEIAVSLCQALAQANIVFDLAWQDQQTGTFFKHAIPHMDELTGVMGKLLQTPCVPGKSDAFMSYTEAAGAAEYEHIVYVSCYLPSTAETFAGEGRITAVICSQDAEAGVLVEEENKAVHFCTPQNYETALYVLEI